jgi:hypothetical protein
MVELQATQNSTRLLIFDYFAIFPMATRRAGATSWWSNFFIDHPDKKGPNSANAQCSSGKWKVYCEKCFTMHIADIQRKHAEAQNRGQTVDLPQAQAEIEAYRTHFFYKDLLQYYRVIFNKQFGECMLGAMLIRLGIDAVRVPLY